MKLPESVLTKKQSKTFTKKIEYLGKPSYMVCTVRYDDECGNGHNSFAITADIYWDVKGVYRNFIAGGCLHDEIYKYFPNLRKYIKWHLVSSDGPMHYVANSLYHARTVSHSGYKVGEPVKFDTFLKFKGIPFTFGEKKQGFFNYLDSVEDFSSVKVEEIPYDGSRDYDHDPNYSLTGFIPENSKNKWYTAPYMRKNNAEEFLEALQNFKYEYVKVPYKWCEAVEPDLEAARECAVWPDAELEDFTEEKLLARLPSLMEEFKADIEELGFVF
ncbi:hypothetical protein [Candidatus Macondimonas diazotrophica]|uniref:Uncharacterized protein n=1 Tax=Candidatus Macondimonas diazotrophica TaxID=2305248 RepID=A0A4Z0F7G3_9GAMM|nr:hypothetical protein [Candidatus Macondimonas diazotrophica]TFZ81465.1 hypothetical protein E4680_12355 [Candidatus Macondimonas diazotrophica]